jgi:hypothetical protein
VIVSRYRARAFRSTRDPAAEFRASQGRPLIGESGRNLLRYRYHHAWKWTGRYAICRKCGLRRRVIKSNLCEYWGKGVAKVVRLTVPHCLVT